MTRSAGSSTASRRNFRNDHFLELANTICRVSTPIACERLPAGDPDPDALFEHPLRGLDGFVPARLLQVQRDLGCDAVEFVVFIPAGAGRGSPEARRGHSGSGPSPCPVALPEETASRIDLGRRFTPAGAGRTCSSRQRKRRGAEECTGEPVGPDDSPRDITSVALASQGIDTAIVPS